MRYTEIINLIVDLEMARGLRFKAMFSGSLPEWHIGESEPIGTDIPPILGNTGFLSV